MRLSQLFSQFRANAASASSGVALLPDRDVTKITFDSRKVDEKTVFVAIRGSKADGHSFLPEVLKKNPAAVVIEGLPNLRADEAETSGREGLPAATFCQVVPDTRVELERLARVFYGDPAEKLFSVAVTGTNGKTSTTYMVEAVLNDLNKPTGVIGTVNHHLGQTEWATELTTPDALTLQERLADFLKLGAKAVAFEASSHALSQNRVGSIAFDAMVFTNLTRDHLDYHKTMEDYFHAKEKLFHELPTQIKTQKKNQPIAIINYSDEYGPRIRVAPNVKLWSYGEVVNKTSGANPNHLTRADFQFKILKSDFAGTTFELTAFGDTQKLHIPLVGKHNVYNAVAAIAVGVGAGGTLTQAHSGLKTFKGVPGRLQRVQTRNSNAKDLHVFVDYAHTDDALKTVLSALHEVRSTAHLKNKIITVFGCGGDRDKGKRPLMAKAAMAGSDFVVITSDNPRTESPASIVDDILSGVGQTDRNKVAVEIDRKIAIRKAIEMANPGDVVLIAGKGHEDYQIIGTQKFPFSDFAVAEGILNGL